MSLVSECAKLQRAINRLCRQINITCTCMAGFSANAGANINVGGNLRRLKNLHIKLGLSLIALEKACEIRANQTVYRVGGVK